MSLIIENKEALDNLANAIIQANASEQSTSATKSQLIDMVNNIIPYTAKFASGTFIPAEDIGDYNGPIIPYAMGTDDNGNTIYPDMIFTFQPYALSSDEHIDASVFSVYAFSMKYHAQFPVMKLIYRKTEIPNSSGRYGSGSITGVAVAKDDVSSAYIYENGFRISGLDAYKFKAQHPIVWMQLKF